MHINPNTDNAGTETLHMLNDNHPGYDTEMAFLHLEINRKYYSLFLLMQFSAALKQYSILLDRFGSYLRDWAPLVFAPFCHVGLGSNYWGCFVSFLRPVMWCTVRLSVISNAI